jgi:hypothetical protein
MRTKTLLLSAAALLAAGIVSTQAQPVYSQNVVGYANVVTAGGTFALSVPFAIGNTNGANEIWPLMSDNVTPTLPDGSEILIWNGNGYNSFYSDSGSPTLWDGSDGSTPAPAPELKVGQGFFLIPSSATTNVFAGTIPVNVGSSNVTTLSGGTFLVAPVVPYAGSVTNGNLTTGAGGPNLWAVPNSGGGGANGIPDGSELLIWNGNGYNSFYSDSGSPTLWDGSDGSTPTPAPTIKVGQGFFIIPSSPFTWTVGL